MTAVNRVALRPAGVGLRSVHHAAVVASRPPVGWFEIHAENYLSGGAQQRFLHQVRRDYPISIHAVGLSLGSAEGIDTAHLDRVAGLIDEIDPFVVSEHLAWSIGSGIYHNDLLPLPYTEESLAVVAANVGRMQERVRRRVLIENPSTYLRFAYSPIAESEFLSTLSQRTGCGILLDVNNAYVSAMNHGLDASAYIDAMPKEPVGELHLAGHHVAREDGVTILIDDHGSPVADPVWTLYEQAAGRFPTAPTLVEWDNNIPSLETLVDQARRADAHRAGVLGKGGHDIAA